MAVNRIAAVILSSIALVATPTAATAAPLFGSLGGAPQTFTPVKTVPSEAGRYVTLSDCTGNPADDRWVPVETTTCGDDPEILTAIVSEDGSVSFLSYQ